jgi:hypothetical protein
MPEARKTDSGLPVPANCTDVEIGQIYWKFVYNFMAIPSCRTRLAVLKHASSCPACFSKVLELYQEMSPQPDTPAAETDTDEL